MRYKRFLVYFDYEFHALIGCVTKGAFAFTFAFAKEGEDDEGEDAGVLQKTKVKDGEGFS